MANRIKKSKELMAWPIKGPRCNCGGLLIRVWNKATQKLLYYRCIKGDCGRKYIKGQGTDLLDITTCGDLWEKGGINK